MPLIHHDVVAKSRAEIQAIKKGRVDDFAPEKLKASIFFGAFFMTGYVFFTPPTIDEHSKPTQFFSFPDIPISIKNFLPSNSKFVAVGVEGALLLGACEGLSAGLATPLCIAAATVWAADGIAECHDKYCKN